MVQMNKLPLADERVALIVSDFLMTCGKAVDDALDKSRAVLSDKEWEELRKGFGRVLGGEIYDMWSAVVGRHPHLDPTLAKRFGVQWTKE